MQAIKIYEELSDCYFRQHNLVCRTDCITTNPVNRVFYIILVTGAQLKNPTAVAKFR